MKRISLLWETLRQIRVNPDKGTVEVRGQRFLLVPGKRHQRKPPSSTRTIQHHTRRLGRKTKNQQI